LLFPGYPLPFNRNIIEHTVQVSAQSLYEAFAGRAI
jgi:hypothetical protein